LAESDKKKKSTKKKAAKKKAPVKSRAAKKKKSVKKPASVKPAKPAAKKSVKSKKKSVKKPAKKQTPKKTVKKVTTAKKKKSTKKVNREERIKSLIPKTLLDEAKPKKKKTSSKKAADNKPVKNKPYPEDISESELKAIERGDEPMTVVDHLDEMRSRLLYSLMAVILLTFAGFFLSDHLLNIINRPFVETGQKLNIFKLTGGFLIRIKASFVAGLMLGLPIILYHVWKFIAPAISKKDRRFSLIALVAAFFLFYGGMAFVFFIILPFAINMLLGFIGTEMLSTIGASDYMSFILMMSIAMGLIFELPIVVMILTRIGILTPEYLIHMRKYSVVAIFIIAALITPQDIFTMILVAIPLMFLYEVSIVISRLISVGKKKREE
jgi:sec-independent protein translocase protein TatC